MSAQTKQDSPEQAIQPCQIFLIEDDPDDRMLAERELEKCEAVKSVKSFPDGKVLTDYMKEQGFFDHSVMLYTPVLLLVDLEMPRKDGIEVIKELKSDPFLEPIPLIVVTSSKSTERFQQARRYGAQGIFRKPLTRSMIEEYFNDAWQWPPKEMY
jgi:CheY-like chemotaxis protein